MLSHQEIRSAAPARPPEHEEDLESIEDSHLRRTVHDLKNWVSGIKMFCDGALMEPAPALDLKAALMQIQSAAHEAARLCEAILTDEAEYDFDGPEPAIDPGELLGNIQNLLAVTLPKEVELRWDVEVDLPPIEGDVHELDRVLLNLIKNAAEALEGRAGCVTVRGHLVPSSEPAVEDLAGSADCPPQFLLIEVEDTGCGMDEATLARIDRSSFTTKTNGHGLGLASVRKIVEQHHGRIELHSRPGRGTKVRLWFPCQVVAETRGVPGMDSHAKNPPPRSREQRILWIDDDRSHRELGRVLLESRGYLVSTKETTEQALKALAAEEAAFSVILLDMHLPDLPGGEALRKLQALAPQLPVIIVSGSSRRELEAELGCLEPDAYVEKPFDIDSLVAAVHKVTSGTKHPVNCAP